MTCSGVTASYAGLIVTRFLIGVFEAGFFPVREKWKDPFSSCPRILIILLIVILTSIFRELSGPSRNGILLTRHRGAWQCSTAPAQPLVPSLAS